MILTTISRPVGVVLFSTALAFVIPASASAQQTRNSGTPQRSRATPSTPAQPAVTRPGASAPEKPTAQQQPAPGGRRAPASAPGGSAATLVASFGDWGVYTAQSGRTKICYALTQPKDRQPKNVSRDPAYLFVSFRPAENVRNEVALVMGFPTRENGAAEASVGNAKYALLTKDQNAWLKNPAEEGQAITTMSKSQNVLIRAQSNRGTQLTDRYSLSGFGSALERARRECS
jgi:hypothetical protein